MSESKYKTGARVDEWTSKYQKAKENKNKSIFSSVLQFRLKDWDYFGESPSLSFNGKEGKLTTACGGFLTMILFVLTAAYTFRQGFIIYNGDN